MEGDLDDCPHIKKYCERRKDMKFCCLILILIGLVTYHRIMKKWYWKLKLNSDTSLYSAKEFKTLKEAQNDWAVTREKEFIKKLLRGSNTNRR